MSVTVKLNDVIEALEGASENLSFYLDQRSGEIILLTSEDIQAAEDDDLISDYPDWQRESILKARELLRTPDEFLDLPSQFDIHEYKIMEDFCLVIEGPRGQELRRLIKGSGAFRRFKNAIHELHIEDAWSEFRGTALQEIAIEWLEENKIAYTRDDDAMNVSDAAM